jgi:NADPH2:quinone reductase
MVRPGYMQEQWQALLPMIESGVVKPPIGSTYRFEEFGQALVDMDQRRTLGKSVVRVRG